MDIYAVPDVCDMASDDSLTGLPHIHAWKQYISLLMVDEMDFLFLVDLRLSFYYLIYHIWL
jgi:hypothetical protein